MENQNRTKTLLFWISFSRIRIITQKWKSLQILTIFWLLIKWFVWYCPLFCRISESFSLSFSLQNPRRKDCKSARLVSHGVSVNKLKCNIVVHFDVSKMSVARGAASDCKLCSDSWIQLFLLSEVFIESVDRRRKTIKKSQQQGKIIKILTTRQRRWLCTRAQPPTRKNVDIVRDSAWMLKGPN